MDLWEVARQNRITEQILQSFLEKKLFPNIRRPRPPSVWEILPKTQKPQVKKSIQDVLNETESSTSETLQSVESEQISSIYDEVGDDDDDDDDDDKEGMCCNSFICMRYLTLKIEKFCVVSLVTKFFI